MEPHPDSFFLEDTATGGKVYVERIQPDETPEGWVLLLHGLGDHIGRHGWIKDMLLARGYGVLGIDWPGCGLSHRRRGDLPTMEEGRKMVENAIREADVTITGVFAHSTGGFFLLRFLAETTKGFENLRWAWFSSPLVRPDTNQGPIRIAAAKWLGRVFPHMTLSTHVRRDDCYHTAPSEEPKKPPAGCHNRIALRFAAHLLSECGKEKELAKTVSPDLRLLFTQGLSDPICPPDIGERLYLSLPPRDRTFIARAGSRHEPFREPDSHLLYSAAGLWLDQLS